MNLFDRLHCPQAVVQIMQSLDRYAFIYGRSSIFQNVLIIVLKDKK